MIHSFSKRYIFENEWIIYSTPVFLFLMNIWGQRINKYHFEPVYYIHLGNTRDEYTSIYEALLYSARRMHYGITHPQAGNEKAGLELGREAANIHYT
jgi:hypothetical protein